MRPSPRRFTKTTFTASAPPGDPGGRVTVDFERPVLVARYGREIPFEIEPDARTRLVEGLDGIGIRSRGAHRRLPVGAGGPVTTALT